MPLRYALMTDSCCDLPEDLLAQYRVCSVPLSVRRSQPGASPIRRLSQIDVPGFYRDLRTGLLAFTSAVPEADFEAAMEPLLAEGQDILYIGFSDALSATCRNARLAATLLQARYPERTVCCIDSKSASMGQGLLVLLAARMAENGGSLAEVAEFLQARIPHLCHWFTVDNLRLLKRGGRISATLAVGGSALHMCPLLHMDDEGHLVNTARVRGREAVIRAMFERFRDTAEPQTAPTVLISHGDCIDDARYLSGLIRAHCPAAELRIGTVSPVIGAHSGPGTLALFFEGTKR